jgi:hypothetical protein
MRYSINISKALIEKKTGEKKMREANPRIIAALKERYKEGARVELIQMDDIQAPPIGTQGTVIGVDDIGSIMVRWDNGSSLSVVYGEDHCRLI